MALPVPTATDAPPGSYFARGKLLLTGEYLALDGARALAAPTHPGQWLRVGATDEADVLHWLSRDHLGALWFEEAFSRRELRRRPRRDDASPRARVVRMLRAALSGHPLLWPPGTGLRVETGLQFPRDWGLGSSATLAYLLAAWAGTDAFALNAAEFGGSGYDVACAGAEAPLRYGLAPDRTPRIERVHWAPACLGACFLVHLGHKRDSRAAIADYRAATSTQELRRYVDEVDALTDAVLAADDAAALAAALRQHEALVGYVTHQQPIGRERFGDFAGAVKSLGAWGGDFALAVPTDGRDLASATAYFQERGCGAVLPAPALLRTSAPRDGNAPQDPVGSAGGADPAPADWPTFLYGALAEPRQDNEWLRGRRHRGADLVDFRMVRLGDGGPPTPVRNAGSLVPGALVYLTPDEVRAFDLHPEGRGYRRQQVWVDVEGLGPARALAWLPG